MRQAQVRRELVGLGGRSKLTGEQVSAVLQY